MNGQILFAVRFFGAEFHRSGYWIGMLDSNCSEIGFALHRNEVSAFGLDFELLAVPQSDRHREWFVLLIRTDVDSRDGAHGHLTVNAILAVHQDRITIAALNETRKYRVLDGHLPAIIETHDDFLAGRLQQKCKK